MTGRDNSMSLLVCKEISRPAHCTLYCWKIQIQIRNTKYKMQWYAIKIKTLFQFLSARKKAFLTSFTFKGTRVQYYKIQCIDPKGQEKKYQAAAWLLNSPKKEKLSDSSKLLSCLTCKSTKWGLRNMAKLITITFCWKFAFGAFGAKNPIPQNPSPLPYLGKMRWATWY